jgi:hypothetical protein
MYKAAGS